MSEASGELRTSRLHLVPIGPGNAADYWLVHNDDAVAPWYGGWRPSRSEAAERARWIASSWRLHGVHKWMVYERGTGEVVGRGGLSRTPIDDDWGRLYAVLPDEPWVAEPYESERPFRAHARWVEIGWALRGDYWGQGYASEIGRAGLAYAFDVLAVRAVVSCTDRHNERSRAVMGRIGMRYVGDIGGDGTVDGEEVPLAVSVMLRSEREPGKRIQCTPARSRVA
jgi:RimJ/RimL family protein N-acetyltransferase